MAQTAVVTIQAVEPKDGISQKTGKPWRKFIVHTTLGDYSTFDAGLANIAFQAVGKSAEVTFDVTNFGNDLKSLVVGDNTFANQAEPHTAPASTDTQTPRGDKPDWELIGLHKTRCALWCAYLSANGEKSVEVGRRLVIAAEADIFRRGDSPAHPDDDVPF